MDQRTKERLEKSVLAGGVISALGGVAFYVKQRQITPPRPEILNDDRLSPARRWLVNRAAAHILFSHYPDRKAVMAALQASRDHAGEAISYLKDSGLIIRQAAIRRLDVPSHYVATEALAETVQRPADYPLLAAAQLDLIKSPPLNDNL